MTISTLWLSLFWGWTVSEVAVLLATRTRHSTGNVRDRGSLRLLWLVIVLSVTAGTWFGESHSPNIFHGAPWIRPASAAVLAAGLVLRWTAILTLGRSFSANVAIHATQTVHKTGLFHFVRHPSYSGLLIIFFAVGFHTRNWLGLAMVLLPATAALLYRIRVEEIALNEAFGREYAEYSRVTKRLLPGIY